MTNALIFLITTLSTLFCAVLFIRAWIFWRRIPAFNPYAKFIYDLTDFIIIPVRKIIPSSHHIDTPSFLVAYLVCLLQVFLVTKIFAYGITNMDIPFDIRFLLLNAFLAFCKNLLSVVLWLSIFYAILSWLSPFSPFLIFLHSLLSPIINSIRQILPNVLKKGPFDFSLMFLVMIIIALQMIFSH